MDPIDTGGDHSKLEAFEQAVGINDDQIIEEAYASEKVMEARGLPAHPAAEEASQFTGEVLGL